MDADRFDSLLRSLVTSPSRRGALRLLAVSTLGSLLLRDSLSAAAKKKGGGKKGGGKKKACKHTGKVAVCHNGQTIQVSNCALKAHQRHGDKVGACQTSPPKCQPSCTGGKICQSNGTCACPANMSPCAADGTCVATELCCTVEDPSCPAATFGPLECQDGVCVCASARNAPCPLDGGGWYCCGASSTCCNDDSCCEATCTVQAGECTCPGGSGPCSAEFDGITFLICCGTGDTCSGLECFNTTCSAGNSTRGGPIAICGGASNQCRCATKIEDDSHVCVDFSQGFACPAGCPETPCTGGKVCVDNISCGLPEGQDVMPSCLPPCP